MIRINLLKPGRASGSSAGLARETAAPSRWVSRGEVWVGAALLAMGAAVLAYLISLPKAPRPGGDQRTVDARPAGPVPSAAEGVGTPRIAPGTARASAPDPALAGPSTPEPASSPGQPATGAGPEPKPPAPAATPTRAATPAAPPVATRSASPPSAGSQVSGISITRRPGALVVSVAVGPGVKYHAMELKSPSRLVIDFPDCQLTMPAQLHIQAVSGSPVQRVRASQYRVDPPVCRIVLDAASLPSYQVRPAAGGMEIQIAEGTP